MLKEDWKLQKSIFIVAKRDQIESYKFVTKSSKFTSIFWLFFQKIDVYQALHRKSSNTLVQNLESVTDTLTPGPFWGGLEVPILLLSLWFLTFDEFFSRKGFKMSLSRSRGNNSVMHSPSPRRANSPAATSTPKVSFLIYFYEILNTHKLAYRIIYMSLKWSH